MINENISSTKEYTDHQYNLFKEILEYFEVCKTPSIDELKETIDSMMTDEFINREDRDFLMLKSSLQHILLILRDLDETHEMWSSFDGAMQSLDERLEDLKSGRRNGDLEDWCLL